MNKARYCKNR